MKLTACRVCGLELRPCNLARHFRAQHLPKKKEAEYGTEFVAPKKPIRIGKKKDRRYDEIAPRGEGPHRYRLYRLRAGDLHLVSTAPDAASVGLALVTNYNEGEFSEADDSVGILDTATDPGSWIANPFALGRRNNDAE